MEPQSHNIILRTKFQVCSAIVIVAYALNILIYNHLHILKRQTYLGKKNQNILKLTYQNFDKPNSLI